MILKQRRKFVKDLDKNAVHNCLGRKNQGICKHIISLREDGMVMGHMSL